METLLLGELILIAFVVNTGVDLSQQWQGSLLSPDMAWKFQCSPKAYSILENTLSINKMGLCFKYY